MNARTVSPRPPARRLQRGAAVVEFALVGLFFFTLLFGILELGRALYVWNTVQEVTRNAARLAVVRDFRTEVNHIQRAAVFQSEASVGLVSAPGAPELTNAAVSIAYLDRDFNEIGAANMPADPSDNMSACNDVNRVANCIRYVRASLQDAAGNPVAYMPMVPLFGFLAVDLPISSVTMPAESLGFTP